MSDIITCLNCQRRVIPSPGGICPSCQKLVNQLDPAATKKVEPPSPNAQGRWSMTSIGWLLVFLGCLFGGMGSGAIIRAAPGPEKIGALSVPLGLMMVGFALVVVAWMKRK